MTDRRYLITVGSPECPGFGLAVLRRVAGDVERIVRFFTNPDQGYEHTLVAELPIGATAGQIRDNLEAWFAHEDRRAEDCVVVYIAGHGDSGVKFRDHTLLVRDSEPRRPSSVIRTAELARWFFDGEGERPQNVLLILDVCYAGQGGGEAGAELVKAEARALRGGGAGFWVIATADPNTEAGDGAFVDAFLEVMKDDAWVPRGGAPFLSPDSLSVAVNGRLPQGQKSVVYGIGIGRVEAPFIRNPDFTRDLDGVSVADRAHWDPKARGVDVPSAPGWFFTGRHKALRDLSAWLVAERSDFRARVVTGGPGSGKSAVLGWLVLASREEPRQSMQAAGLLANPELVPPVGAVAARIHARGMRLNEMTESLASLLSSAARDPSALMSDLSSRPGPIGIVVDSLDEAAEAVMIERELLSGLAICPPVRLIVGGRKRNRRPPLAEVAAVVDLDADDYFERADLAAYVFSRLTFPGSVYVPEDRHADARRIAERVAERAGYSFLYARLVSRTLAQAGAPVDTGRHGWPAELKLPEDLTDAFGADLDRFDPQTRRRFIDLFVPLAYARGKGLPQRNVWATIASRIAEREYTNADLRDLKDQAGFYLVQDTESGEVVFRLFHQTFADYLKALTRDEDVERTFAKALLSLLPASPAGGEAWSQVGEPYLLNHFPSHASAGGLLEEQLRDPDFLLQISPEALLPELHSLNSTAARRVSRAYRRAVHWIRAGDDDTSLTYLLWGAYQYGALDLAERLQTLRPRLPWYPEWAAWQKVVSGHVLGQAEAAVTALTAGQDDSGSPVALCGYEDGAIRVWSLAASENLLEIRPRQLNATAVEHLALASIGRELIVGAWKDGSLGIFDLQDGSELGWVQGGAKNRIRALCVAPEPPDGLLVTATSDFSLHVWQIPTLELIRKKPNAAAANFYSLAPLELRGEAAVVSGTDTVKARENTEKWPVRAWRARDLKLLWRVRGDTTGSEVRVCKVGKTSCIVVRPYLGDLTFLNPSTQGKLSVPLPFDEELSGIIGFLRQDSEVILIGQTFARLRVLRLRPVEGDAGETLAVEDLPIRTEVRRGLWSDVIELNGRPTLVSSDDRQIRVWDVQELLATGTARGGEREANPFGQEESALVTVAAQDARIVTGNIGNGFSDLRLWTVDGRLLWSLRFPNETLQKVALAEVEGSATIVCGTGEGFLHTVSALDGAAVREPIKVGWAIRALSVRLVKGKPTAFLAVNLKPLGQQGEYVVRVWDLATGEEIKTTKPSYYPVADPSQWKLAGVGYYRSKILWCVDALEWNGGTLVAFAGPHGEVTAMGLETLEIIDRWEGGVEGDYVHSLVVEVCEGRPLAFGGDEHGRLFAHDLETMQDVCPRLDRAHRGGIAALLARQTPAGACVVSGGKDGVVHFWTKDLVPLARIETEHPVSDLAFAGPDRLAVATDRGLTLLRLDWDLLFSRSQRLRPR